MFPSPFPATQKGTLAFEWSREYNPKSFKAYENVHVYVSWNTHLKLKNSSGFLHCLTLVYPSHFLPL